MFSCHLAFRTVTVCDATKDEIDITHKYYELGIHDLARAVDITITC